MRTIHCSRIKRLCTPAVLTVILQSFNVKDIISLLIDHRRLRNTNTLSDVYIRMLGRHAWTTDSAMRTSFAFCQSPCVEGHTVRTSVVCTARFDGRQRLPSLPNRQQGNRHIQVNPPSPISVYQQIFQNSNITLQVRRYHLFISFFSHYSIQLYQLFKYYYLVIIQLYQLFKYLFYSLVYHSSICYSFSCSPTQDSLIDYQVPANQCQKNEKNSVSNTFLDFFSHCLFVFILPVCASWAITIARYFTTGPACSPASRLLENVKTQRKKTARSPPPKQYMFIINTATTSAYQRISLTALHKTVNARHLNTELSLFKGDASPIIITTKRNVFTNLCRAWLYPETCTGRTSFYHEPIQSDTLSNFPHFSTGNRFPLFSHKPYIQFLIH